jgi:hypothetical protein
MVEEIKTFATVKNPLMGIFAFYRFDLFRFIQMFNQDVIHLVWNHAG